MTDCRFCEEQNKSKTLVLENELFYANFDGNPVTEGHMKIMSKRHVDSFFDLTDEEMVSAYSLIKEAKKMLDEKYHPDAYNVGVNIGKASGQTVFHLHFHLIPRYTGDVEDPVGGVRNVIPEKGNYLKNKS